MLRMKWTRQRCQAALNTWAIAALRPSCASEITSLTPHRPRCCKPRRKPSQKVAASEGPMPRPRISRRPSWLTPTAIMAATDTTRPPSRILRYVASSQRRAHSPVIGRLRKPLRSSISWHRCKTWLFEVPLRPMVCTRSSILRVEMHLIQASWSAAPGSGSLALGFRLRALLQMDLLCKRLVQRAGAVRLDVAEESCRAVPVIHPAGVISNWVQANTLDRHPERPCLRDLASNVAQPKRALVRLYPGLGDEHGPPI